LLTILITAYAVNPYKGSEDGLGWNYVFQAAKSNKIIAITRKNNREHIEKFQSLNPEWKSIYDNMKFLYFDWPKWLIFWKKGPLLAMIYYYFWQLNLIYFIKKQKLQFDIAHNLTFVTDWAPSFLWMLKKPFVWGPVSHHEKIPKQFILPIYGFKAYAMDRYLWFIKNIFWKLDPFLKLTSKNADVVICANSSTLPKLNLKPTQVFDMRSIASSKPTLNQSKHNEKFLVFSAGRFVPLKGFDITLKAFAKFYHQLNESDKKNVELKIVGKGPFENLMNEIIVDTKIGEAVEIIQWIQQHEMANFYNKSSVFLFPSHEGAGVVVAEALSYALPVLCFNNYGPGVITPPNSTMKIDYKTYDKNVEEFAEKLMQLFQDKKLLQHEKDLALSHFNETLDWDTRSEKLNQIYNSLINKNEK
jgi:glycosyltransferase involved in cell wall biosynthesis